MALVVDPINVGADWAWEIACRLRSSRIRTDGKRVLVVTHSGKSNMKEHYVFSVDDHGEIWFEE